MISVIIPTWNGKELLQACLESLDGRADPELEIIVVDNGSTDGTIELLANRFPEVRLLALSENMGFTGAANAGIQAARGDRIALLNNDAVAERGWLEALDRMMDSNERCGMVASLMVWMDSPELIDSAGDGFTIAGFGYKRGYRRNVGPPFDRPQRVFSACGGAALLRKQMLDEIGMFDPSFFAFGEDLDLSFRALLAGWVVLYEPEARVRHRVRATATPDQALFLGYRNLMTLLIKNMPGLLLVLYSPFIIAHLTIVLVGYLFKGSAGAVLGGHIAALRRLPATLRERRHIQGLRRAPLSEIRNLLNGDWIGIMLELSGTWQRIRGRLTGKHLDAEEIG